MFRPFMTTNGPSTEYFKITEFKVQTLCQANGSGGWWCSWNRPHLRRHKSRGRSTSPGTSHLTHCNACQLHELLTFILKEEFMFGIWLTVMHVSCMWVTEIHTEGRVYVWNLTHCNACQLHVSYWSSYWRKGLCLESDSLQCMSVACELLRFILKEGFMFGIWLTVMHVGCMWVTEIHTEGGVYVWNLTHCNACQLHVSYWGSYWRKSLCLDWST
jgi:hypothetical protein